MGVAHITNLKPWIKINQLYTGCYVTLPDQPGGDVSSNSIYNLNYPSQAQQNSVDSFHFQIWNIENGKGVWNDVAFSFSVQFFSLQNNNGVLVSTSKISGAEEFNFVYIALYFECRFSENSLFQCSFFEFCPVKFLSCSCYFKVGCTTRRSHSKGTQWAEGLPK